MYIRNLYRSLLPCITVLGLSAASSSAGDFPNPEAPKIPWSETNSATVASREASAAPRVRLLPGVSIIVPVNVSVSIRRAAADLQRDLAVVLGAPSPLVDHRPTDASCIEILPPDSSLGGPEAHT